MTSSRLPRRIVCTVVRIDGDRSVPTTARFDLPAGDRFANPTRLPNSSTMHRAPRPSQLLPWADPYIAKLVHRLQDEVRRERNQRCRVVAAESAELEPPAPGDALDVDWEFGDDTRWSHSDLD